MFQVTYMYLGQSSVRKCKVNMNFSQMFSILELFSRGYYRSNEYNYNSIKKRRYNEDYGIKTVLLLFKYLNIKTIYDQIRENFKSFNFVFLYIFTAYFTMILPCEMKMCLMLCAPLDCQYA